MECAENKGVNKIAGWREVKEDEVYSKLARHKPESIFVSKLKELLPILARVITADGFIGKGISLQFHSYIKGSLKWSSRRPEIKTTLFCPEDQEWNGSVIVNVKGHVYTVAVFWPFSDCSFLFSALKSNDIVDWQSKPTILLGIPKELNVPFEEFTQSLTVEIAITYTLHTYLMTAERARNLEVTIPEDLRISNLDQSHASTVNSAWLYARQESLKLVEDMIGINPTLGLFTDKDSRLVSWALQTFYGLGMLYTVPEFSRRGYGSTLAKALSKALGEEGTDAVAMVRDRNTSAHFLFKKLCFENLGFLKVIET